VYPPSVTMFFTPTEPFIPSRGVANSYMFKGLHPFFILMVIGLMGLLAVIVIGDLYHMLRTNQPFSYSVLNLVKLAAAGILGAIAGYLAKE